MMTDPAMSWKIVDSRTGKRASIASYSTREQAERKIQAWRDRDAKGKRPDVHEMIPHLAVAPLSEP